MIRGLMGSVVKSCQKQLHKYIVLPVGLTVVMLSTFCLAQAVSPSAPQGGLANAGETVRIINQVIIEGNEKVADDVIMTNVRSRPDAQFNEKTVSEDSRRIIIMPQIRNVTWTAREVNNNPALVDIIFSVKEAVTVSRVEFVGNKAYKEKKLRKQLPFKEGEFLDNYLVTRGGRELEVYYRDKGYYFASVAIDNSRADSEGVVVYNINEGERLKINKIRYEGRKSFPQYKLKGKTKTRTWFPIFSKGKLDDIRLEADIDAIAQFYHEEGFLDAQVSVEKKFNKDNSRLEITYLIDEGPRYTFTDITYQGNSVFSTEEIKTEVNLSPGVFARQANKDLAQKAITRLYGRNGYIYARANPRVKYTDTPGEAILDFNITEGDKFYLNRIFVTGNYETQDKVVRRDFDKHKFLPGNIYDQDAADKAQRRLAGSGIFESVDVQPIGTDPNSRDALVEVTESNTGMLLFGVGVDTNSGVLGQFSIEQRNFDASRKPESFKEFITGNSYVGAGQRLKLSVEPGTEMTRANLKFYEPYLYDQPYYLEYNLYLFRRFRESHEERRKGTSLTLGHRFDNDWSIEGTSRFEQITIDDFEYDHVRRTNPDGSYQVDPVTGEYLYDRYLVTPPQIVKEQGDNWLTSFKVGVGQNTTDRLYRPTEGYKINMGVEQFGFFGGDFDFTELSAGMTVYQTIYEDIVERRTVWATRVSGSKIFGDAPTFEKFYAGGIGTARGFEYRGISPRDGRDNDPIGSDYMFLVGTELVHPVFEETLFGKIFCDSVYISEGSYRVSVGFGFELIIPQFFQQVPMSFDFGFPMRKDDEDDTQLFSFNFGMSF
ncbi:MAG: outer membrane protein assembly factor BamA [Sedimentisphaerales bacterium]|nr:outer membrane protein assembly factor BamA [Sedimentisphaerales bacterium]